jgi:hypothetical protein
MKKLPRELIRREDQPDHEPEIWQPSWQCFCCHDTGEVNPHLARLIIDGYEQGKDKIPRCQNPGCSAGNHLDSLNGMIDYRFSAAICQELNTIHREDWRQTTQMKAALIGQKISKVAKSKSLRKCDRTPEEKRVASLKHQENLVLSPLEQDKQRELVYGDDS